MRGIIASSGRGALVTGEAVTANYFDLLGIPLEHGRGFRADENLVPDASPVIVDQLRALAAHAGRMRRRRSARPFKISGLDYTVIGVASREFSGLLPGIAADFWVPLMMVDRFVFSGMQASTDNDPGTTRLTRRGHRWLFVKGRLEGRPHGRRGARADRDHLCAAAIGVSSTNKDVTASVVPASSVRFHPMLDGYFRGGRAAACSPPSDWCC